MASLLPTRFFWLRLRFCRFRRLRLWFCRRCRRLWLRFNSRFLRLWLVHGGRIGFWFLLKFFVGHGRSKSNRIRPTVDRNVYRRYYYSDSLNLLTLAPLEITDVFHTRHDWLTYIFRRFSSSSAASCWRPSCWRLSCFGNSECSCCLYSRFLLRNIQHSECYFLIHLIVFCTIMTITILYFI